MADDVKLSDEIKNAIVATPLTGREAFLVIQEGQIRQISAEEMRTQLGGTTTNVTQVTENVSQTVVAAIIKDSTGVPIDLVLGVGEEAFVTYTAATSVPLGIAVTTGQLYELIIAGVYAAPASAAYGYLKPNNTDTGAGAVERAYHYAGTGTNNAADTTTNFTVTSSLTIMSRSIINTTTATKSLLSDFFEYQTGGRYIFTAGSRWTDTTTAWTSLGTLVFSEAQSGKAIIRRLI